ncbi:cytochrome P450 [Infundibulicybe gibba]|nr:cytochrome P450 [Infundibulicybe gibba]
MPQLSWPYSLILFAIVVRILWRYYRSSLSPAIGVLSSLPLPPGPKTSWFGNVALPQTYPWLTYYMWKELYGDIIYIHVFGNPVLVLNSAAAISDLLEKRSGKYSSRPIRTMIVELMGWDWLFSSMKYGNRWKRHRTLFHRHFQPSDSSSYHPLQIKETHCLLRNLLYHPGEFRYHVRRTAAAIILDLTYGHQVANEGDEYVTLADRALQGLAQAGIFGTYMVDYLPILKYLPPWFPFASFQRKAMRWRRFTREMVNKPFDMVKQEMEQGSVPPCFVGRELENRVIGLDFEDEDIIKNVAATTFAAGADTIVSVILSLFLALGRHPDVQSEAQRELDAVLGNRLPTFNDKGQLPFIDCICYELLRWNPVTPLGIAHYVSENDVYRGFQIPKGTTVLPNVWAVLHDPDMYPDPLNFNPARFLDKEKNARSGINEIPDPAFGFGRRMCPGRWLAFDSIWITVASILATFHVSSTDHRPRLEPEYTSSLLSHPKPFQCTIVPRNTNARCLVEQTEDENY